MKRYLLIAAFAITSLFANAQTYSLSGEFSSMNTNNLRLSTNGSVRMTVQSSNGYVGIGATAPTEALHVSGNVLANQYSAVNGIYNSSIDLKLNILNSTKLFIESTNGFIGIGTTAPTESLDIFGTARFRAVTANNAINQILVVDATGKVFWRDVASLTASISDIPFRIYATSIGVGSGSQISNTTAGHNTSLGYNSLSDNTTGVQNTAIGYLSLEANNATSNTGVGSFSLQYNTSGYANLAVGAFALQNNTTGFGNVGVGNNTLISNITGSHNTGLGRNAGPSSSDLQNTTSIGYNAFATASNSVRIGNSSVTSIGGQVSWSTLSDGRFKADVKEDVSGLEFINLLRPVTYALDQDLIDNFHNVPDSLRIRSNGTHLTQRQTGFIAQEVDEIVKRTGYVFHGVEEPQSDKDHYSIRYSEFVVPLVKAVQELSAKVEAQQKEIEALRARSGSEEINPDQVVLFQNKPNPFKSGTEIMMNIPDHIRNAELIIYDLNGKQLEKRTIHQRGRVSSKINGGSLSAGMYLYTLITDDQVAETKRMILN